MSGPVDRADAAPVPEGAHPEPPTAEVVDARESVVGTLTVRRSLPKTRRRTVDAWCFVDHFGALAVGPDGGIDAYAQAAADLHVRQSLTVGAQRRDPVVDLVRFGARLDGAGLSWAATGALAAAIQAPHQTQVAPWAVYVTSTTVADLLFAASSAGLEPINGGRLELRAFPSPMTQRLTERVEDVNVVPWLRALPTLTCAGVGSAARALPITLRRSS